MHNEITPDLVMHPSFKNHERLLGLIKTKLPSLKIHIGELGSLEYEKSLRIGLGYDLRENKKEECIRLIIASYLCLNEVLDFGK